MKRNKIIKIRVTDEEFETLKWRSTKHELARWMRETCLNDGQGDFIKQAKGPDPVDPALLRQLAGIGNNLNQVARKVNTQEWSGSDRVHVIAALAAIERELKGLREAQRFSVST